MTGPEHSADPGETPGSNAELPADDVRTDEQIDREVKRVYDQVHSPLGAEAPQVREGVERATAAALTDGRSMDRQAEGDRAMAQFEVEHQYGELALSPEEQRTCRRSGLALTLGLVVSGLAIAGVVVPVVMATAQKVANTPKPKPDDPEEDAFEKEMRTLVDAWQKLPEKEYWAAMEQWVEENNPSWYRQRYVLTYARSIAKDESSGVDMAEAVRRIVNAWNQAEPKKASRLYDLMADAKIKDVPLTRAEKLDAFVQAIDQISPRST